MDIDNLLKELKGEETLTKLPESVSESCWKNIKQAIKVERTWYDRMGLKLHNVNMKYRMKFVFQAALILIMVIAAPSIVKRAKVYLETSPFFKDTPRTVTRDNENNELTDTRPEYIEKDTNYLKAREAVRAIAKERYKKFSLYSTGEIIEDQENRQSYYYIEVYENSTWPALPSAPDILWVDTRTLEVKGQNNMTLGEYFSTKTNRYDEILTDSKILMLINESDHLNFNSFFDIYSNIDLYVNIKHRLKEPKPEIPEYAFYYVNQENIYYTYDNNEKCIYKHDITTGGKEVLYKHNPEELSLLTKYKTADIDGDGKEEETFYDPISGVLGINGVSIYTSNNGVPKDSDFYSIVDIYDKDRQKEIYIDYDGYSEYSLSDFYSYKDGVISKLLSEDGEAVINGSGIVTFKGKLSQFFQTHSTVINYQYYKDNSLRGLRTDLIKAEKVPNQEITAKVDLKIYKDKESTDVAAVIEAGEKIKVIGYDEGNAVLLENLQGISGWIEVKDVTVKELNLPSWEVFDGLAFAN